MRKIHVVPILVQVEDRQQRGVFRTMIGKGRLRNVVRGVLIVYLVPALVIFGGLAAMPPAAQAMFLPSAEQVSIRSEDTAQLRRALESKVVRQRLADFGVTPEEVSLRMSEWTDDEIHQLSGVAEEFHAGGSALGTIALLLVIALLAVLVLHLTGHKVIITK